MSDCGHTCAACGEVLPSHDPECESDAYLRPEEVDSLRSELASITAERDAMRAALEKIRRDGLKDCPCNMVAFAILARLDEVKRGRP